MYALSFIHCLVLLGVTIVVYGGVGVEAVLGSWVRFRHHCYDALSSFC